MIPFVPSLEDRYLNQLIKVLNTKSQPIYVNVKPAASAIVNECFPNVDEKIKNEGGTQILGWQIWKTEHLIEAEFHAIWESENKNLLDITPKPTPYSQILFIEDNEYGYNGSQVDNVRINISGNSLVDDLIIVCEALFKIANKGNRAFEYELYLSDEEQKFWTILQQMKQNIPLMLLQGLTKHQRCFCGRGEKYKKCHGKFLP